ncbi:MAG: hypothetical protein KC731_32365 [Myxococcales bacterium]|nr:hypothetical protein [Myxococcales bacterium]
MSIATKPETVAGRSWGPFGAGILAVLGCFLLTAGATVVFDEPDPEMIGELVGRAMPFVFGLTALGTHLLRKGAGAGGYIVLGLGLLMGIGAPAATIYRGLRGTTAPLRPEDRQAIVVASEGDQLVARHPRLGFSFTLPPDAEKETELPPEVAGLAEELDVTMFRGEEVAIICALSGGLPDTEGFLKGVRNGVPEAHRASISASGEGVNRELRFGMTTDDGTHVRSRVIFVEGAGGRLHAVALQVGTNDEALAQSIVDSLTRDR